MGVNRYTESNSSTPIPTLKIHPEIETTQKARLKAFKNKRSQVEVSNALGSLRLACQTEANIMPVLVDGVDRGVTLGEVSDIFREVFGVYRDPGLI